ncbi:YkvA family protein [Pelagibius marinus]|uniref:YkvA family protein n=1 Tax=Pelagibius marinus TaxID=2762760 RepID=UPI001D03BA9F|nr:YkvA family protein [Pelagibius marinus]
MTTPRRGRELVPYTAPEDPKNQDPRVMQRNAAKVEKGFWVKLRRSFGQLPFLEEAVSAYYCAFDPRTPRPVKAMLLAALAYFVVPSDMIPDFIAGLGFTDDATVLFATLRIVSGNIKERHRSAARRRLSDLGLRPPAPVSQSREPESGAET